MSCEVQQKVKASPLGEKLPTWKMSSTCSCCGMVIDTDNTKIVKIIQATDAHRDDEMLVRLRDNTN